MHGLRRCRDPVRAIRRRVHALRSGHGRLTPKPWASGKPLFVQISDTHIGFNKEANPDVNGTLTSDHRPRERHARSNLRSSFTPATSPICRSRPNSTWRSRCCRACGPPRCTPCRASTTLPMPAPRNTSIASARPSDNKGYYSFDHAGVHFIGLINVLAVQAGRPRHARAPSSSPGLPPISRGAPPARPSWSSPTCRCGRSTSRGAGERATPTGLMSQLRRFGSVTVLERSHSSDRAESRRQHHLPHGALDRLSAAGGRRGSRARAAEGARGSVVENARGHQRVGR